MDVIDRNTEKRVWQRIYGQPTPLRRECLLQCLRREEANFHRYDNLRHHSIYGDAFGRLADDALEHIKMLRRILGK
jgi:hypothetical protein